MVGFSFIMYRRIITVIVIVAVMLTFAVEAEQESKDPKSDRLTLIEQRLKKLEERLIALELAEHNEDTSETINLLVEKGECKKAYAWWEIARRRYKRLQEDAQKVDPFSYVIGTINSDVQFLNKLYQERCPGSLQLDP